jgi:hypothetical protein
VFGRQGDLTGLSPILSDTEQKGTMAGTHFGQMGELPAPERNYLGAAGPTGTPRNYIMRDGQSFITHDGQTDSQTGQPLPPGGYIGNVEGDAGAVGLTNSVRTDLQSKRIAYDQFDALVDQADTLLSDPTRFGPTGAVRSFAQEMVQLGQNLSLMVGANSLSDAVERAAQGLAANGVDPSTAFGGYDTGLPAVDTVWGLIVYSGASALAGQENRSVSDKDVVFMRQILGSPKGIDSAEALRAKLSVARDIIRSRQTIVDRYLGGGGTPPDAPTAPAQGAPAPMQQAAPPAGNKMIDLEGNVISNGN